MSTLSVKQAAGRLRELDKTQQGNNGIDLSITASGGYGKAKQTQLLSDIREVYAYIAGQKVGAWPFGDDAA
jgi:hypothetical protein